jgi:ABC-2 type transport system permease protein
MKAMISLLKREFWEHKGMFLWTPLCVAAAIIFVFILPFLKGNALFGARILGRVAKFKEDIPRVSELLANMYLLFSGPLLVVMGIIIFFYCLGALFDDRRDRSILFWKSLPVSDFQTVLSKLITASLIVPVIFIMCAIAMSFVMLMIVGIGLSSQGVYVFQDLFLNGKLYLAPLQLLGTLPVYILWALPSIGWLMLVSSWAHSRVFLWAVGIPLLLVFLVGMLDLLLGQNSDMKWFSDLIVGRALGGVFPGVWIEFAHIPLTSFTRPAGAGVDFGKVLSVSWQTLLSLQLWLGVVAAAGMFYMTVRLRRWREAA